MKNEFLFGVRFFLIYMCLHLSHPSCAQENSHKIKVRGGSSYRTKIMRDQKSWMITNLNVAIAGSYPYQNNKSDTNDYGRLYTWEAAKKGCMLLGKDWHLPTNDEWRTMAKEYGGIREDAKDGGKLAYYQLIKGGPAGFNAVYGGQLNQDGTYARVNDHGFYWSASASDSANAWIYNFGRNGKILNRHPDMDKNIAISVRCVRKANNNIK